MKQLLAILFLIFLFSCNKLSAVKVGTNNNEKLVQQYFAYFNQHDWDKMAGMYTENADFKDPSLGPGMVKQTRKQIAAKYQELSQLFPDIKDEIVNIYPAGENNIIVEFISTGTAPDKSTFKLPVCTIFTIENGLITKDFTYYDNFEE